MPSIKAPKRGFSFKDHSRAKPTLPLPGDRLDTELDRILLALTNLQEFINVALDADGSLRGNTVGEKNVQPKFLDHLVKDLQARIDNAMDTIDKREKSTQHFLTRAKDILGTQTTLLTQAQAQHDQIQQDLANSIRAAASTSRDRSRAERSLANTTALTQTAETAASSARIAEDMAYRWAEKLDGPVFVPNGGDPVNDGFYSAKFWALYAQTQISNGSFWFLGVHPQDPTQNNIGGPILPGMWYFNSTDNQTYIFDGTGWQAISGSTGNTGEVLSVFGRVGAVQAAEADYASFYPLKVPTEAHIANTDNPHNTRWSNLGGVPSSFPPSAHGHTIGEVTDLTASLAAKLDLAGGTMTGPIVLPGDPANPLEAATKAYVDANAGSGGGATVPIGADPPEDPQPGQLWWDNTNPNGPLFLIWNDTESPGDFVWTFVDPTRVHVGPDAPPFPIQGSLWFRDAAPTVLLMYYVDADSSQWIAVSGGPTTQPGSVFETGDFKWRAVKTVPVGWRVANGAVLLPSDTEAAALRALLIAEGYPHGQTGSDPILLNMLDDGGRFARAVDGTTRLVGSKENDAIENRTHPVTTNVGLLPLIKL